MSRNFELSQNHITTIIHILSRDIRSFKEDHLMFKKLSLGLILYLDDVELIKVFVEKIDIIELADHICDHILKWSYYGSKIFNYLIGTYSSFLKQFNYKKYKEMIFYKMKTDFAGLVVILNHMDPKIVQKVSYKITKQSKELRSIY